MVGNDGRGGSGWPAFRVAALILVFMVTTAGTVVALFLTWSLGPWLIPTLWRWVFVLPAVVVVVASILMWCSGSPRPRTAAVAMMLVLGVGVWILLADGTWTRLTQMIASTARLRTRSVRALHRKAPTSRVVDATGGWTSPA